MPADPGSKLGFAILTERSLPVNGLRHPPEGDTNGWYIWCGEELSSDPLFFVPMHTRHMQERCPDVLPLLGLAAAFAGLRRPDVFGLVISQSGSFWWEPTGREWAEPNWIARQFLATSKLPLRFYLEAGLFELDLTGKGGSALLPNRHLRDVLLAKGYDVQYREFPGGHESVNWGESFPQALQAVFGSLSGSQGRVDPVPPRKHR